MENVVADHLSRLRPEVTPSEVLPIDDSFLDHQLLAISHQATPWCADLVNFKARGALFPGISYQHRNKFLFNAKYYVWEEPLLYKLCGDGICRRCLLEDEVHSILHHYHASTYGVHFGPDQTIIKVLQAGFYCPLSSNIQENCS